MYILFYFTGCSNGYNNVFEVDTDDKINEYKQKHQKLNGQAKSIIL